MTNWSMADEFVVTVVNRGSRAFPNLMEALQYTYHTGRWEACSISARFHGGRWRAVPQEVVRKWTGADE